MRIVLSYAKAAGKAIVVCFMAFVLFTSYFAVEANAADLKPDDSISYTEVSGSKYTNCSANLRTGNSTDYRIIDTIKKNTEVKLIGRCENGWYKVDCGGTLGFMANSVLSDVMVGSSQKDDSVFNNFEADKDIIASLNSIVEDFNGKVSFYAETADGGHIISCDSDRAIFVASAMKVPLCMYICQKYEEKGEDILSEVHNIKRERKSRREDSGLAYHPKYYPEALYEYYGEGVLSNDLYKTRDLMDLALTESDNLAKDILQREYYDRSGFNKWLKNIGCRRSSVHKDAIWLSSTAEDLVTIWKEYYRYSQESESGELLFGMSQTADDTRIRTLKKPYAGKYGYTNDETKVYIDSGMVLGDNPYYIAMTFRFKDKEMDFKLVDEIIELIDEAFEQFEVDADEDLEVTIDE